MTEAQWFELEEAVRESIRRLPDADEFTVNDIGRIIARVRRVNNDVLDISAERPQGTEVQGSGQILTPVYSYLISEIIALCIELVRVRRRLGFDDIGDNY